MSDKIEVNNGGLGLTGWLTLIFVIAKLAGVIKWSWWVVFLPVLISFGLVLAILAFALIVAGLALYFGIK